MLLCNHFKGQAVADICEDNSTSEVLKCAAQIKYLYGEHAVASDAPCHEECDHCIEDIECFHVDVRTPDTMAYDECYPGLFQQAEPEAVLDNSK